MALGHFEVIDDDGFGAQSIDTMVDWIQTRRQTWIPSFFEHVQGKVVGFVGLVVHLHAGIPHTAVLWGLRGDWGFACLMEDKENETPGLIKRDRVIVAVNNQFE